MDDRDQYMSNQENLEQSRILWIILSALTVIAIVIAAGLFFFFPSEDGSDGQPQLSSVSSEKPAGDFDPFEYVRNDEGYPEMEEPAETESDFAVEGSEEVAEETEEVSSEPEEAPAEPETNPNVIPMTPAATTPENVEEEEIPLTPVKKEPETRKISVTVYWIQVGSYRSLIKAEDVRNDLLEQDISCEIQTRAVDGTTYYRVRIGAFQSKGEADKFLDDIKKIENFGESYVVQTTMIREVPVN